MVLGGVLFLTGVWHESVLRAGFMIAPGPLLAGLTAFPGGLLGARFGHRAVGTAGSLLFAAGGLWWITHVGATPGLGWAPTCPAACSAASASASCSPRSAARPPHRCRRSASPPAPRSTP